MARVPQVSSLDLLPPGLSAADRHAAAEFIAAYEAYSPYFAETGEMSNAWAMLNGSPAFAKAVLGLGDHILHAMPWSIENVGTRELVIQTLARDLRCGFLAFTHWHDPEKVASIELFEWPSAPLTDLERAVIRFTHESLAGGATDETHAEVAAAYGDRGVLELTACIAYWSFWCIMINTLQPDAEPRRGVEPG